MRRIMVLAVLMAGVSMAEIPLVMSYQGKVTDGSGNPVADGSYTMRFRIYNAASGGTALWDSGVQSVAVSGGTFSVLLGESPQPAINLDFNADYWLLVTFAGVDQSPRQRLASTGYAYMASGLVAGTEVVGPVTSGTSAALRGTNTATSGSTSGLKGTCLSPSGRGVEGYADATSGMTYGVVGYSASGTGTGVWGVTAAAAGVTYGVYGSSASTSGRGVCGASSATTGTTYGVYGSASSTSGFGVYSSGNFAASGSKSCVVKTSQGPALMYCQESPENWFEDFGEGQLVGGRCHIELDPLFLETVTIDEANPMKVFVTPEDPACEGMAVVRGSTGFDVVELHNGTSDSRFAYRVVAKRKGYAGKRLDCCAAAARDPYLFPELRGEDPREHEQERMRMEAERARHEE